MRWLFMEGLVPLMGASFIFVFWGACRWLSAPDRKAFAYAWAEAFDPLGWLYGAAIIGAQSAWRSFSRSDDPTVSLFCAFAGVVCIGVLVAGMTERAALPGWKPPPRLFVASVVLVAVVLGAGYYVQVQDADHHEHSDEHRGRDSSGALPADGGTSK